mmetsp:Transcript_182/g.446  ORF Transcript_182/g.446 Transcript_182/m.446 type:complete len:125 (-) Transcript_182:585-959(-)
MKLCSVAALLGVSVLGTDASISIAAKSTLNNGEGVTDEGADAAEDKRDARNLGSGKPLVSADQGSNEGTAGRRLHKSSKKKQPVRTLQGWEGWEGEKQETAQMRHRGLHWHEDVRAGRLVREDF